jgi:Flp pilus assembly pilin Flp
MPLEAQWPYPRNTMFAIMHLVRWLPVSLRVREERGAVAAEYALVLALIAMVIIVALTFFGLTLLGLFEEAPEAFPS